MTLDSDLEPALLRKGLIAPGQQWVPMQGGRTNRLWRVGEVVVKRYAPQDGNPRFPNDPAQEAAVLHHLGGQAIAPRLTGQVRLNGVDYLLYQHLKGAPWSQDPAQVGQLLRRLHGLRPPSGLRALPGGSRAILQQVGEILPALPTELADMLWRKRPDHPVPPLESGVFLHGDVVAGNVIVTATGPRLIDWQCPAVGDPAEDLAIFLSPAMQRIYRGTPLDEQEVSAFLTGYGDPVVLRRVRQMQPWHHWAMAAYCAWKSIRGAAEYSEAMALELAAL